MTSSSIGQQVLDSAKSGKFRLEFSESYSQHGVNGVVDVNVRGLGFQTKAKAKVYLPADASNAEVAITAIHEGIHEYGIIGSRRAEALARLAEIQHQGGAMNFSTMRSVVGNIRTAQDVTGKRVYMDLPWQLFEKSTVFLGAGY